MKTTLLSIASAAFLLTSCAEDTSVDPVGAQLAMDAQSISLTHYQRGEEYLSQLKEKAQDRSEPSSSNRALKMLESVKKIDKICEKQIDLLDKLRKRLMTNLGESLKPVGMESSVLFEHFPHDPVKPDWYRTYNVKYVGTTDFLSEYSKEIISSMKTFRTEFLSALAASASNDDQKYFYKPPMIGDQHHGKKLSEMLDVHMQTCNVSPDDRECIKQIYINLSYTDSYWSELLHADCRWENVFSLLTALQSKVLEARSKAFGLIRSRSTGCDYSFDRIAVMTPGTEYAKAGEEVSFDVFVGAYDSDRQPIVRISGNNARISVADGKAKVTLKAPSGGSEMEIAGTITIVNKSGIPKTLPWKKKIVIGK